MLGFFKEFLYKKTTQPPEGLDGWVRVQLTTAYALCAWVENVARPG
jgi:hypothetical protein